MNMLTAYYIDTLAQDHWQQARAANQYSAAIDQKPGKARQPMTSSSSLKQRLEVILNKLHPRARFQA